MQDWNRGRIPFHTEPPVVNTSDVASAIVEEWSNEFSLPEFIKTEKDLIETLPDASVRFVPVQSSGAQQADWDVTLDEDMEVEDEDEMEEDEDSEEEEEDDEDSEGSDDDDMDD